MLIDPYTWHTAAISDLIRESPHAVSVVFDLPNYTFLSGQHAVVRASLPDGSMIRQYSFASAPNSHLLELTIVKQLDGAVSTWFVDKAQAGDTIELSQPFNGPLRHDFSRDTTRLLMIGGGSGIVPLMSHLRSRRAAKTSAQTTVLYSTRRNDACYSEELLSRAVHETIVTRLTDNNPRLAADDIAPHLTTCDHILICGSRPFVTAMRSIVTKHSPHLPISAEAFSL